MCKLIGFLAALLIATNCFGQSGGVIRGESGSGTANYITVQVDSLGRLYAVTLNSDRCADGNTTKTSVAISITSATTTQLVAISGTTSIYVCSFSLTISQVVTTANTIKFVYGTGSSCGTGTADLTGLYGAGGITAGIPIVVSAGNGSATLFKTIAAQALCVTTAIGGSGSFQGVLTYIQV